MGFLFCFFFGVVWILYTLWILAPYQIYYLKIFLPFSRLLSYLVEGFLCRTEVFSCFFFVCLFDSVPHIYFLLLLLLLLVSDKSYYHQVLMSRSLLPIFSSRSFMFSGLTFKSLIHFELIYVYSNKGSVSCFLMWLSNFPNAVYWRDCPLPIVYS